jgi:hypothetical protein
MIHESDLKLLLLEYDRVHGEFPENCYEGFAVWEWLQKRHANGQEFDAFRYEHSEEFRTKQREWRKEVEREPKKERTYEDTY